MFEPQQMLWFVVASLILLITPGPAVLYVVARSISQGTRAGIISSLGLIVGGLILVAAGALGLNALTRTWPVAFDVLRYGGATYLIYLAVLQFRQAAGNVGNQILQRQPLGSIFTQGIVVNLLNPKAALFILAFLPQFVDPVLGAAAVQFVVLGAVFFSLAFVTDTTYAVLAGRIQIVVRDSSPVQRWQPRISGMIYLGLGIATAVG